MKIAIRYFASVREALGSGESADLGEPAAPTSIAMLRDALAARGGRHGEALGRHRVLRTAVNLALCAESTWLADGDEVGFFPPVTGG
ncbi:MAG: MoaD/ThiS family protein [Caldimonas sp.]